MVLALIRFGGVIGTRSIPTTMPGASAPRICRLSRGAFDAAGSSAVCTIEPVRALASWAGSSGLSPERCRTAYRPRAADCSAGVAAYAHTNCAMGWPHVLDQGFAGLVLQLFKRRGGDADWQGLSLGFQVAWALCLQAEHDFSHTGYRLRYSSILGLPRRFGRCGLIRGTAPADTSRCFVRRASPMPTPGVSPPLRLLARCQGAAAPRGHR